MSRVHELGKMSYTELMALWQRHTRSQSARTASSEWDRDQLITAIRNREEPVMRHYETVTTVILHPQDGVFAGLVKVVLHSQNLAVSEEDAEVIARGEAVRLIPENRISEIIVDVSS